MMRAGLALVAMLVACTPTGGETTASAGTTSGAGSTGEQGSSSTTGTETTQEAPGTSTGEPTSTSGTSGTSTSEASTSEATSGTTGAPAQWPAEVLDLSDWKLTLPIAGDDPEKPLEILQPELATYSIDPWYVVGDDGQSVRFRADAGGVTTSNSGYPRSELREMMNDGAELAAWSTTEGVHTMTITQAITHLPEVKPHVVAGQIHDASDDVVMIRLEGEHLFVEGGGAELGDLDPAYQLGTPFTVRVRAAAGVIEVFYQDLDTPAVTVERDATGCYFKAGVYTQSNVEKGDAPEAYGEVVISELVVTHE
jgi:hypothetical protein